MARTHPGGEASAHSEISKNILMKVLYKLLAQSRDAWHKATPKRRQGRPKACRRRNCACGTVSSATSHEALRAQEGLAARTRASRDSLHTLHGPAPPAQKAISLVPCCAALGANPPDRRLPRTVFCLYRPRSPARACILRLCPAIINATPQGSFICASRSRSRRKSSHARIRQAVAGADPPLSCFTTSRPDPCESVSSAHCAAARALLAHPRGQDERRGRSAGARAGWCAATLVRISHAEPKGITAK